MGQVELER